MTSPPTTEIEDYVPVGDRLSALNLPFPAGLALLPTNFDTAAASADFRHAVDTPTLRKLLRQEGLALEVVGSGSRPAYVVNRGAGWVAPVLFISASFLSESPAAVSIALNVLSGYIHEAFKGTLGGSPPIKLEVVVEKDGDRTCKRITYEGGADGLQKLPPVIRSLSAE